MGLKFSVTHQLLYADDVNLLRDNIDTVKKDTETLVESSKEIGLEVNAERTMYMFLSGHRNAGQNYDVKIAIGSFKMYHSSRSKFDSGRN
jgi:ABC-type siderophore export system fused ATPase/permease subunit